MAKRRAESLEQTLAGLTTSPRSRVIAERGVKTPRDLADLMSAVMADVVEGRLTPSRANAIANAAGKRLDQLAAVLRAARLKARS